MWQRWNFSNNFSWWNFKVIYRIKSTNYKILFRSSNPVASYDYSGILIESNTAVGLDGSTLVGGFKIIGYNTLRPYFKILEPIKNTNHTKITVGTASALLYKKYRSIVKTITYGTVFATVQEVVDFVVGYGKYLESQGFVFDKFSNEIKVAVERNKHYLDWRYIQKPNEDYKIVHCYSKENAYLGFVIYTVKEKHNGKIAYIMELLYDLNEPKAAKLLLDYAISEIKKEKADCNYSKRYKIIWIHLRTSYSVRISICRNAYFYSWANTYKRVSDANKKNES